MSTVSHHSGSSGSPIPKMALGLLLLVFFVIGSVLHIQTSEAFFMGGKATGLSPNWAVLGQPILLFQGNIDPKLAESVMWGWGIELVFLICVVGYEIAHESVADASSAMSKFFRTGMFILVAFDGWTDFQYGNVANGFWGQLAFAGITAFVVFFFGTIGWMFIEKGFSEWRHP